MSNKKPIERGISTLCDNCKNEFSLNTGDIKDNQIYMDKQVLILTFFLCPHCNKLYRVAIKDQKAIELQADLEKAKASIRKIAGSKNVNTSVTLTTMVNRKAERLKKYMDQLQQRYDGTFYLLKSENNDGISINYKNKTTNGLTLEKDEK